MWHFSAPLQIFASSSIARPYLSKERLGLTGLLHEILSKTAVKSVAAAPSRPHVDILVFTLCALDAAIICFVIESQNSLLLWPLSQTGLIFGCFSLPLGL